MPAGSAEPFTFDNQYITGLLSWNVQQHSRQATASRNSSCLVLYAQVLPIDASEELPRSQMRPSSLPLTPEPTSYTPSLLPC